MTPKKIAAIAGGAVVLAAGLASGLTLSLTSSSGPSTFYVSGSGSDSGGCTQSAACLTFDKAYHTAKPGDSVQVAAGSYPSQGATLDTSKVGATADVSIGPAPGASVTVAGLSLKGSHVLVHDISSSKSINIGANDDKVAQANQAHGVTLTHVSATQFVGNSAIDVSISHSSFGPALNTVSSIRTCYQCSYPPSNWTLDDVTFHDYTRDNTAQHMECIQTYPVVGLVIRNSRFQNCSVFDVFLADGSGYCTSPVTLENNWFDYTASHSPAINKGYYSLLLRCRAGNQGYPMRIDVRYNSFAQGWSYDTPGGYSGTAIGNAGSSRCVPGQVCSHNVTGTNLFVDPAAFDLNLAPGSPAIDAGDKSDYPSRDIHGHARYAGAGPDAGAAEFGAGSTPPPTSTTTTTQSTSTQTTTTAPTTTTTSPTTTTTEPTTTTQPPAGLNVHECGRTTKTITVCWTPIGGVGYEFLRDGKRVSSTFTPSKSTITYSLIAGAVYTVVALGELDSGSVSA